MAVSTNKAASLAGKVFSFKMTACIVLGFSSGLPLYVLITLLTAYLRTQEVSLKEIGFFSLLMIPYNWKFIWSPFLDRYSLLSLGRRRSWIALSQLLLILCIGLTGFFDVRSSLGIVAFLALSTAFVSATQDIAVDALRREILSDGELGLGNSLFVNAYRIAGLVPGGISLILAQYLEWNKVFMITALCLLPGLIFTFMLKEPLCRTAPRTLRAAVVEPWREFIQRRGFKHALLILAFVFFYKLGDSMATALATPFYIDLGYDLVTIGVVAKNVGLWSMVAGGLFGGVLMLKIGINKALWIFGVGQMITIMAFWYLARSGQGGIPSLWLFSFAVGAEALGSGMGTVAFVSFIASTTNPSFTATQFALLTSLSALPRTFCNAATGLIVEAVGWEHFFLLCTLLALPGMLMLLKVAPVFKTDREVPQKNKKCRN